MEIPAETVENIERIVLKILYNEKAIKSTNLLVERVLAISEKNIKLIINKMDQENKIQFSQSKGGWKIKI